jgi:hypothetical protein
MKILAMLDEGKINAEQAAKLLEAVEPKTHTMPPMPPMPGFPPTVEHVEGEPFDESGEMTRTFSTEGIRGIRVKNLNGRISVCEQEGPEIEVVARSGKGAKGAPGISFEIDEGVLTIKPTARSFAHGFGFPIMFGFGRGPRVDFEIRMPKTLDARLSSVNGRITVRGLASRTRAGTTNGSIRCEKIAGSLKATTTNGTIDARDLDTVETEVKSVNGSTLVALSACPPGECAVKTVNGSVTVFLPESPSVDVEAKTVSGSVRSDFPIEGEERKRRKLSGRLGSGELRLVLKTVNGSIALRKLAELELLSADDPDEDSDEEGFDMTVGFGGMGICIDRDEIREQIAEAKEQALQAAAEAREQIRRAHKQVAESFRTAADDDEDDED